MGMSDEIKSVVNWDAPSVEPADSLRVVIQKMVESNVCALTVKLNEEVVGVVTEMDLMYSIDKKDDLDHTNASSLMSACELISDKAVATPCVQLDASESVENALGVMNIAGVHHLVVDGGDDNSVGIVSIGGLLKLVIS